MILPKLVPSNAANNHHTKKSGIRTLYSHNPMGIEFASKFLPKSFLAKSPMERASKISLKQKSSSIKV
ncbi:hypothetical protein [Anaerotignum propionicum]|uniref:hypothetical protein n=1 Tax=Anaerotignum propionicum TaxID=28446 RepID=UPI0013565338|nr:hypothetical protein [Anaerotignum propionicum]